VGDGQLEAQVVPEAPPAADQSSASRWHVSPTLVAGIAVTAAVAAVVLWGGYGRRWPWTGINGSTATLWEWLHLLLLPIAFGMLPVLLSRSTGLGRTHWLAGSVALVGLTMLVVAGYTVPWKWTGFSGNKLWDWLKLLALPLAVALVPAMEDLRVRWRARYSLVATVGLVALVATVIGGYVGGWSWTGFRGNTLWDWMHLLLLPLLLPLVIVPALKPRVEATLAVADESERRQPETDPGQVENEDAQPKSENALPSDDSTERSAARPGKH
jgi:hypothetical protein